LDAFRKQQEEADKAVFREEDETGKDATRAGGASRSPAREEEQWTLSGRKRKKGREKEGLKGVKRRQASSATENSASPTITTATTNSISPLPETPGASVVPSSPVELKFVPHKTAASPPTMDKSTLDPTKSASSSATGQPSGGGLSGLVGYGSDDDD
jgi:hypothetical protein